MSILLLRNPKKQQDILDDIESVFWVIVYVAAKYFEGDIQLDMTVFDQRENCMIDGEVHPVGGRKVHWLLFRSLEQLRFTCEPLGELIRDLAHEWGRFYLLHWMFDETEDSRVAFERKQDELSKPSFWIAKFDIALRKSNWEAADTIPDRYPRRSWQQALRIQQPSTISGREAALSMLSSASQKQQDQIAAGESADDRADHLLDESLSPLSPACSDEANSLSGGREFAPRTRSLPGKRTLSGRHANSGENDWSAAPSAKRPRKSVATHNKLGTSENRRTTRYQLRPRCQ